MRCEDLRSRCAHTPGPPRTGPAKPSLCFILFGQGPIPCFGYTKKPGDAGLWMEMRSGSGGDGTAATVHHLGFEFGFKGLNLAEHGKAARRAAHLPLELVEHFMQTLGSGPEGWVVLSCCGVHVHGGSVSFLDNMIVFADDLG